jgi:hypothetical protein
MNGYPTKVSYFAHELRKKLFNEHSYLSEAEVIDPLNP